MRALTAEREKCNDAWRGPRRTEKGPSAPKRARAHRRKRRQLPAPSPTGRWPNDGSRENDPAHLSTKVGADARQPGPNRCAHGLLLQQALLQRAVYGAHWHTCGREAVPLVLAPALAPDTPSLINNGLMATLRWNVPARGAIGIGARVLRCTRRASTDGSSEENDCACLLQLAVSSGCGGARSLHGLWRPPRGYHRHGGGRGAQHRHLDNINGAIKLNKTRVYNRTPPPRRHWYWHRGWYTGGSAQATDQFACAVSGLTRAIKEDANA